MAFFRIPLWLSKKITFWKLLGCGKNGSFDIQPDWRQWGVICVLKDNQTFSFEEKTINRNVFGKLISSWWKLFNCKTHTIILEPIEGHGTWDRKEVFGRLPKMSAYEGKIAVLTRATLRINKLKTFFEHAKFISDKMRNAEGFISSVGIGEIPWIKQATFSIWESKNAMKNFAYKLNEHKDVIRKTREENWYKEDMFVRFKIHSSFGELNSWPPTIKFFLENVRSGFKRLIFFKFEKN